MTANFQDALTRVYLENPCQTLPNPLWKMLDDLADFRTAVEIGRGGQVNRLEAASHDRLYLHWTREGRRPSLLMRRRLAALDWALVHQDYLDPDTVAGFGTRLSFFRLIHRGAAPAPALPTGFRFAAADPAAQAQTIAGFFAACHADLDDALNADTVSAWAQRRVYAPELWLWVWDEQADTPAALGIAAFDRDIREVSIEWAGALPAYHQRGLDEAAVRELLRRASDRAAFITAAGRVEDRDNPGAFYRRCGFTGSDVWWLLADPAR